MRLVRLVVAGMALGAVGGFAAALLQPRTVHRSPAPDLLDRAGPGIAPLPERDGDGSPAELAARSGAEVRR